jgi:hypothetical protein
VENCNIINIEFLEENKFEDLVAIKDLLAKYKGSDPVILNVQDNGDKLRILSSQYFWVQANNDLKNLVNKQFSSKVNLSISSIDVN